jgi:hypothetical protein
MTDLISVTVNDGKYTIRQIALGKWECLRNGAPWPAMRSGPDNLHVALATELADLRQRVPLELLNYEAPPILSDSDGHLLEAVLQAGAHMINDDATVYAFTEENLLRFIKCALNKDFTPLWDKAEEKA